MTEGTTKARKASQRSNSNTPKPKPDIDTSWGHDLHRANVPKVPRVTRQAHGNPMSRLAKNDLLYEAATTQPPFARAEPNVSRQPSAREIGQEINIRGTAGPYVVMGSNFAPGTTAADIESAMVPTGGEMQSCRIITASPTVIAEMVFTEKYSAESVISTFNNKKV